MREAVIENPVINSAFVEPQTHFRLDDGMTSEIAETRRPSAYLIPVAKPEKKSKEPSMNFHRIALSFVMMLVAGLGLAALGADAARGSGYYGAVYFVDAQHGWYAGSSSSNGRASYVVWATSNGGRTLKRQSAHLAAGMGLPRLAFASRSSGLWASPLGVRRTTNGGRKWVKSSENLWIPWIPRDIGLASAKVGWASSAYGSAGDGGRISRSTDGGRTWRSVKTVRANAGQFGSLSCPTRQRCYVLGSGKLRGLWATSDAGKHWVKRRLPGSDYTSFAGVDFPTSLTGWVVGWNGAVAKTTDGGATWTWQNQGGDQDLTEVTFTDALHGWAVGAEGVILHTDDGGKQWTEQYSGTTGNLDDVFFLDRLRGWAVAMGARLRTTNGGVTWKRL